MTIFDLNSQIDTLLIISQKNRRYLSRFDSTFGYLIITKNEKILLTDNRYYEMAQEVAEDFSVEVVGRYNLKESLQQILKKVGAKNIGFEDSELTVSEFESVKQMLPDFCFVPIGGQLAEIKKYKQQYEIDCITKAQEITDKTFLQILSCIKEGMTEKELSVKLQCLLLQNGGDKNSFDPIVSFGENTSKPHAHPTDRILKNGDNVLMDFGCVVDGYCSDMTRTVFFGQPKEQIEDIYNIVLEAQLNVLSNVKQGMICKDVDGFARQVFRKYNVEDKFTHALGHGLGIDIHEIPSVHPKSEVILQQNMFVTVEPGLYFPGLGGVRIEDLILIEQYGIKNLTTSDKNIIIIK
ncbi:MAG: aminopeptidase P family protein [Clostridia bacterium]|nr:aminopeptidase P family protein [Clostridia bacterium]